MTKLLIAHCCGKIYPLHSEANVPVFCMCNTSAAWWTDPIVGDITVFCANGPRYVSVLGLHNGLLMAEIPLSGIVPKETCDQLCEESQGYLFKELHQLVIRFRPDCSRVRGVKFTTNRADVPPEKRVVLLPKSREEAETLVRVGMNFLENLE